MVGTEVMRLQLLWKSCSLLLKKWTFLRRLLLFRHVFRFVSN